MDLGLACDDVDCDGDGDGGSRLVEVVLRRDGERRDWKTRGDKACEAERRARVTKLGAGCDYS